MHCTEQALPSLFHTIKQMFQRLSIIYFGSLFVLFLTVEGKLSLTGRLCVGRKLAALEQPRQVLRE